MFEGFKNNLINFVEVNLKQGGRREGVETTMHFATPKVYFALIKDTKIISDSNVYNLP